jgi:SAM-dependent methyltransferase
MPDNRQTIKPPRHADQILGTLSAQIGVSVVVAILVAAFHRETASHASFYTAPLAAGVITFLIVHYLRTILFLPPRDEDVSQPDPAQLTSSITSAVRSTYAISSNWLSLWRSPNFRYYLHLDASASLIAYSDRRNSYLLRLSKNENDLEEFWNEGLQLLDQIAISNVPVHKHRLRLLIYPQWVYDTYKSEVEQLIRSHTAARIPCIPLVADELYPKLTPDEREKLADLAAQFDQTALDKAPPRPALVRWFIARRIRRDKRVRPSWRIVFPDMLLVDANVAHDTAAVWWYTSAGQIQRRRHDDDSNEYSEADGVFRILCNYARTSLWNGYAPDTLGGVAIAASAGRPESEIFFAREYYGKWLEWIDRESTKSNPHAKELAEWMSHERRLLSGFVERAVTTEGTDDGEPDDPSTCRLLDVGCGFGRDIVELLTVNPHLHAVGIDVIERNISDAWQRVYEAKLADRAALFVSDAEALSDFGKTEAEKFDLAICMTNTLGNLTAEKQERCISGLREVLKPGGRALVSVYSEASVDARLESYRAIGLRVESRNDHIEAAQGLRSQHFDAIELRTLLERNGLTVVGPVDAVTNLGWAAVVEPRLNS